MYNNQIYIFCMMTTMSLGATKLDDMYPGAYSLSEILGLLPKNRRYARPPSMLGEEPMQPGHALVRPAQIMLKSEVKFPYKHITNATWSSDESKDPLEGAVVLNTHFRRQGDTNAVDYEDLQYPDQTDTDNDIAEVLARQENKTELRQNKLWDFKMTGNHINVNPWLPDMTQIKGDYDDNVSVRPWWYFLQDDVIPSRRNSTSDTVDPDVVSIPKKNVITAVKQVVIRLAIKFIVFILRQTPIIIQDLLTTLLRASIEHVNVLKTHF